MRWFIVLAAVLLLVPFVNSDGQGCCIPPTGQCFDGSSFENQDAFDAACEQAGTDSMSAQQKANSCNAYADVCQTGCCCAGQDVFDSPTINSNEDLLSTTSFACGLKDGFIFEQLPQGSTCVDVCGGVRDDDETPPEGTYSISGTIANRTGGNPLEGAEVFVPVPQGDISTISDHEGIFKLENVPAMNTRVFAIHEACQPGQSAPLLVDRNVEGISIELPCALEACPHDAPEFVEAPHAVRGTDQIRFVLGMEDACRDFVQFEAFRCNEDFGNCVALTPSQTPEMTDSGLEPETTYCYKARTRFLEGVVVEGTEESAACITTGSEACMKDVGDAWCGLQEGQHSVQSCDEDNMLISQACEAEQMCSSRSGKPECVAAPACDACNGFMGLFASLFGQHQISTGLLTAACANVCSLDSTLSGNPLMVDAYESCMAVSDCSTYTNQMACENDVCGVAECSWRTVNEELGQGLCVAEKAPDCGSCEDTFGYCTRDMCESISPECYFDGEPNGLSSTKGCINKEEASCRYYDTEQDCTGQRGDARFDISYDDGDRSGGSNVLVSESDDALGLGVCTWTGQQCIKDADMQNDGEDDCIESGRIYTDEGCLQDVAPPITEFFLTDPPVYSRVAVRSLPYSVHDDQTHVEEIKTFVCFGQGCYPSETLSTIPLPEEGTHVIRYYSVDASENSEPIRETGIIIREMAEPAIEDITIEEDT